MNDRDALVLGALLHDVGKFWQRTIEGDRTRHAVWSGRFFDEYLPERWQDAKTLVLNHHDPGYDKLTEMIQYADVLSAGMERKDRDPEERGDPSRDRLSAVLEKITMERNQKDRFAYKFHLKALSIDESLFPFKEETREKLTAEYNKLWGDFVNEVRLLKQEDFEAFFTSLYYLLEKYTWCIPSATYVSEPDISLFDHLKTTAAIANCLYETKGKDEFLFIEGDISGIQDFLYKMTNPQEVQGGMAKRLRGKSFYLSLLTETLAIYLLRGLKLFIPNLLWCGGGHLMVLAPDTEGRRQAVRSFDEQVNRWLYNTFQGDLALNVGGVPTDASGLRDFSNTLYVMSQKLIELKDRKFIRVREPRQFELKNNACPVCGRDVPQREPTICELCRQFEKIGEYLPKLDTLVRIEGRKVLGERYFSFDEFGIVWGFGRKTIQAGGKVTVFSLSPSDFVGTGDMAYGFKLIANEVALSDKAKKIPATFEDLADGTEGAKYLGVLRMDVDNLGAVFSIGLKEDKSISRIAALSRSIDYFFTGYLNTICQEFGHLYVTYAGGDDLFIVGAWNEIVELSQRISDEFKRYACYNLDMHLSAGILLCRRKFPISRGADLAGQKLNRAKNFDGGGKNAVCLFEQVAEWTTFKEVIDLGDYIIGHMSAEGERKEVISRRFPYQLLSLHKQHTREGQLEILQWVPKLLYILTRNIEDEQVRSELQRRIPPLARQIPMLTSYVAMKTRER